MEGRTVDVDGQPAVRHGEGNQAVARSEASKASKWFQAGINV
jgi:hypothetical protein